MLQQTQSERNQTFRILKRYTLLFTIVMLISFFPFFYMNKTLLTKDDGFLQHFVTIRALHNMLVQFFQGNGFNFWSWDIGLGADTIGALATVIFDPFSYIAAIFPGKYIDIGYTISILLQMYTAGLAFMVFARTVGMNTRHTLWGALGYAFSAWVVLSVLRHNGFVTVAILFALLMAGVEKVLRRQSPVLLILAAFGCAVTYFYFAYMSAIMVFLYLIVHYLAAESHKSFGHFLQYILRFAAYVVIAALLSLFVIVPVIYILHCASKSGAVSYSALFSTDVYLNYFTVLTSGKELFANYSCITVAPLFLIMLPAMYRRFRSRQATPSMIMLAVSFLMLLIPLCNSIMNGGSYPVGRWCYTTAFFFIWSGLECLQDDYLHTPEYTRRTRYFLLFLAGWDVFVCKLLFQTLSDSALLVSLWNLACGYAFLQLLTADSPEGARQTAQFSGNDRQSTLQFSGNDRQSTLSDDDTAAQVRIPSNVGRRLRRPVTCLLCINLAVSYLVQFLPTGGNLIANYISYGEEYSKISTSTQKAATEIQDDSFYRVDQVDYITTDAAPEEYTNLSYRPVHTPANETLYWNTRSIYTYLSTTSDSLFTLYKNLCNSCGYYRRICTYGNDNRTRLNFLMGVKYFLGNNPSNSPSEHAEDYASYGFHESSVSRDGVEILKNKYSLGLGCTFQSYLTESEWETLSYADREQALMQCVILPDDTETTLQHLNLSEVQSGADALDYRITSTDQLERTGDHAFTVTGTDGSMNIKVTKPASKVELYVCFKNLKRAVKTAKSTDSLTKTGYGPSDWINAQTYEDHGEFGLYCQKNDVQKRALNTNGTAQGFSDIKDYMINLGYYEKSTGNILISFDTTGSYSYDSLEIIAVPVKSFTKEAKKLEAQKFKLDTFDNDDIKGTVTTDASSMLYLSIPYTLGWEVMVDGEKCDHVTSVDLAFTGIPIEDSGTHTVELHFRPVGFHVGILSLLLGGLLTTGIGIFYHRRKPCGSPYKEKSGLV